MGIEEVGITYKNNVFFVTIFLDLLAASKPLIRPVCRRVGAVSKSPQAQTFKNTRRCRAQFLLQNQERSRLTELRFFIVQSTPWAAAAPGWPVFSTHLWTQVS